MNKRIIIFGLVIGWTLIAAADERIQILEQSVNGATNLWFITHEQLAQIPEWDATTPPPFPLEKAISQTVEWVESNNPKLKVWDIESVSLGKIWDSRLKNRWYYLVSVKGFEDVNGIVSNTPFSTVVLMDGSFAEVTRKE